MATMTATFAVFRPIRFKDEAERKQAEAYLYDHTTVAYEYEEYAIYRTAVEEPLFTDRPDFLNDLNIAKEHMEFLAQYQMDRMYSGLWMRAVGKLHGTYEEAQRELFDFV